MLQDLKILLPGKDGYIKAEYRICTPRKLIKKKIKEKNSIIKNKGNIMSETKKLMLMK